MVLRGKQPALTCAERCPEGWERVRTQVRKEVGRERKRRGTNRTHRATWRARFRPRPEKSCRAAAIRRLAQRRVAASQAGILRTVASGLGAFDSNPCPRLEIFKPARSVQKEMVHWLRFRARRRRRSLTSHWILIRPLFRICRTRSAEIPSLCPISPASWSSGSGRCSIAPAMIHCVLADPHSTHKNGHTSSVSPRA